MRETGYYWVKNNLGWWIRYWSAIHKSWLAIGVDIKYQDKDFQEINESQITKP